MEKYTEAELKLIAFAAEDVITASEPEYDEEGNIIIRG
jgi:hypothetical protein